MRRNPWEGVNLLPFIDGNLLKSIIAEQCPDDQLSPVERVRNTLGHNYCYTYDLTCTDTVPSANPSIGLTDIVHCNSSVRTFEDPLQSGTSFRPELVAGTQIPYPGFPSLNVVPIQSYELVEIKVNCFGSASKYPTMLIKLHDMPELPPLDALAPNVLGKSVFVNWPMMHEAKVVAISSATGEIRVGKEKPIVKTFSKVEADRWANDSQFMFERYFVGNGIPGAGGIQVGSINLRLKVLPLQGMKTNMANGATKKLFGTTEADIPLQLALWQAPAPDPRFVEKGPLMLQDRFPVNSKVVLTKGKHRGCSGVVVGIVDNKTVGVKVQVIPPDPPFGLAIAQSIHESNISSVDASRILKLHPGLFGKITGSLLFEPGRYDLGLNLKSADGMCVVGYTRKKQEKKANGKGATAWATGDSVLVVGSARPDESDEQERVTWEYTPKAIRLVNAYRQKFPQLFNAITKQPNERKYEATKAFGPNGEAWLPVIREWLNNIETAKMPRTPVSTDSMSPDAIAAVERAAEVRTLALKKRGYPHEVMLKVPGSALFREGSIGPTDVLQASDYNKNEAPELGDRVVNFCASGIPFGAKGEFFAIAK
jgi:5'-3' exoribonuclease 1